MIRGVHFYAWNILLVLMGLHLARAFIFGAYKAPRQLVWVSGVFVMLILPAFIITGDLLPWDQKG
jgi:ubiquinol-cytochrome c reductase cytochrome b subunit